MPAARHSQIQVAKSSFLPFFFGPHLLIRVTSIPFRTSTIASAFFASFLRLTPCSVSPGLLAGAGAAATVAASTTTPAAASILARTEVMVNTSAGPLETQARPRAPDAKTAGGSKPAGRRC